MNGASWAAFQQAAELPDREDEQEIDLEFCGMPAPACCGCVALNSNDCPKMRDIIENKGRG